MSKIIFKFVSILVLIGMSPDARSAKCKIVVDALELAALDKRDFKTFIEAGGEGRLLKLKNSNTHNDDGLYILIDKLPTDCLSCVKNRNNLLFLLETETLERLADLQRSGVQFAFTHIRGYNAAAVHPQNSIAVKARAKTGLIIITPNTTLYLLEHEYKHWLDFKVEKFEKVQVGSLDPLLSDGKLTSFDVRAILSFIKEKRGCAVELTRMEEDYDRKKDTMSFDPDGLFGSPRISYSKFFEQRKLQINETLFDPETGTYAAPIVKLLDRLQKNDPSTYREIKSVLRDFEEADHPHSLRLSELFPLHFDSSALP